VPSSRLRQLFKFIRVFGLPGGFRLWCSLLLQVGFRSGMLELCVPGLAAPIRLRPRDLPIFWQIMVMQEYDFQSLPQAGRVTDIYNRIVSANNRPVIIDCGGHIGLSAVWFASHFPGAMVYCVEPDNSNYELLKQNTEAYPNVVPLHGGIWKRPCRLKISNPLSGSASFRLQEVPEDADPGHCDLLRGYTIDEILQRETDCLILVKIDIEGAESEVFEAPAAWLASTTMLIIELHDWLLPGQGTSKNFLRRIVEHNFDVVLQGENLILFQVPDGNQTNDRSLHTHADASEP